MDFKIYVADDDAAARAAEVLGTLPDCCTSEVRNLYGSSLDGVPSVVLDVMRAKRGNTMPLTVVDGHPVVSGELPTPDDLQRFIAEGVTGPGAFVERADTAVQFPTDSRMHISMFVSDIKESVRFYEVFFGQPPAKNYADYAKFELNDPPLVLTFNPDRLPTKGGAVNHFGVQVKSTDTVMRMKKRFVDAGFLTDTEVETPCCYAVQTKVWVGDPDGNRWEIYVVTAADADEGCGPDCPCYSEIAPSRVSGSNKMPVSA